MIKNYKIPEWLKPEEITLSIAERYIVYKKKISEEWDKKQNNNKENVFVKVMVIVKAKAMVNLL